MAKKKDGRSENKGQGVKKDLTDKDYKQVLELASHMWSKDEISSFMDMTEKTLRRNILDDFDMSFEDFVSQANNIARGTLRSAMWRKAIGLREKVVVDTDGKETTEQEKVDGDKGTQIFLAKNYLGMTDKQDHTHKGDPVAPLQINVIRHGSKSASD